MDHCILPELPGKAPWGGKPLSHDIVESALMAAHGYETWFLPELEGSWEEIPANILASLIRERRWMQGNLQHMRLVFRPFTAGPYKEYFINGILAYLSAPLWAIFLLVSAFTSLMFFSDAMIDPDTAELIEDYATILGTATLVVFFLVRGISVASVFSRRKRKGFGGKFAILRSVITEFLFSMIYSPIVMMMMTKFIYLWVAQKSISWGTQDRGDEVLPWKDCFRHFGWMSFIGVAVLTGMLYEIDQIPEQSVDLMMAVTNGWVNPYVILYWMAPVLFSIIFAPWIVRFSSMRDTYFLNHRMFLIPEELEVPDCFVTLRLVEADLATILPEL